MTTTAPKATPRIPIDRTTAESRRITERVLADTEQADLPVAAFNSSI